MVCIYLIVEAFRLIKRNQDTNKYKKRPDGWRVATSHDVTNFQAAAHSAITRKSPFATSKLADGKIYGEDQKFKVEHGTFKKLGYKLITSLGN